MDDEVLIGVSKATPAQAAMSSRNAVRAIEMMVCALGLFFLSDAVFPLLAHSGGQWEVTTRTSGIGGLLRAGVFAATAILITTRAHEVWSTVTTLPWLWALACTATLSSVWSGDLAATLKASIGVWTAMLLGAYIGVRFTLLEQLRLIGVVCVVLIGLSVAFVLIDPHLGIDVGPVAGSWRGAFITKNAFGRAMAFAFGVYVVLMKKDAQSRPLALGGAGAAALLVLLSDSRTSMVVVLTLLGLVMSEGVLGTKAFRYRSVLAVIIALLLLIVAVAITVGAAPLTQSGDPDLLTGRPRLWAASLLAAAREPILGYGLQNFWNGSGEDFLAVWQLVGWTPPHAHNGFLDVALDLGIVGLSLVVVCLARVGHAALASLRHQVDAGALWATMAVAFILFTNLTESTFLRSNLYWAVFVAVGTSLMRTEANNDRAQATMPASSASGL